MDPSRKGAGKRRETPPAQSVTNTNFNSGNRPRKKSANSGRRLVLKQTQSFPNCVLYSNKKETSDFHGTVSFNPVKMSQQTYSRGARDSKIEKKVAGK